MRNVGTFDRFIRALIGLVLVVVPLLSGWSTALAVISIVVGIVLLVTAAISFCPIYALFGLSSKRRSVQ